MDDKARIMLAMLIAEYDREVAYFESAEAAGAHTYASHIDGRMAGIRTAIALMTGIWNIETEGNGVRA